MDEKAKWPVGTSVIMIGCPEAEDSPGKIWKTSSEPWESLDGKKTVVLLEGRDYCPFSVARLQKVR